MPSSKSPRRGGSSQDRRRERRAAARTAPATAPDPIDQLTALQLGDLRELVASASGSTSLPLSARGAAWDADEAAKSLDGADLAKAYFWKDPDGDPAAPSSYKLGFASRESGTLTAVFRGVTAAAGALQGARGGVEIPDGDVAGVKAKVEAYYSKAAKQYDDDGIKPPWAADEAAGETAAFLLAYADFGPWASPLELADVLFLYAELLGEAETMEALRGVESDEAASAALERFGGKPSPGTKRDRRLRENKPDGEEEESPEEAALAAVDALAPASSASFELRLGAGASHAAARALLEHLELVPAGADGPTELTEDFVATFQARLEEFVLTLATDVTDDDEPDEDDPETPEGMPPEHMPRDERPKKNPSPDAPAMGQALGNGPVQWTAVFVPEATLTDDGRAFAPDALTWRDLPLTLMAMIETSAEGGHDGAQVAGRIDRIWREGSLIKASGVFDGGEYGQEIARMVADGVLRGLSVDIAIHEYEVGPESDYFDADGNWLAEKPERDGEEGEPSLLDLLFGDESDRIFVVTQGVIGMATVCPFPAFAQASISLAASGGIWRYAHQGGFIVVRLPEAIAAAAVETDEAEPVEALEAEAAEGLTASAAGHAPVSPPAEWFADPEFEELTALSIDDEGRVYGHAWSWDTCHLAFADSCVLAPRSKTEYAYFHVGEIECGAGERLPVGKITLDTGHAGQRLSRAEAVRHYDDTGTVAAHVAVGEDEFGGWVAGAIYPELTEEKLRLLRGAALSGDWRGVNGNLELVALLAVNVPGFPVPRQRALVAAGEEGAVEVVSLTAAGLFPAALERTPEDEDADLRALVAGLNEPEPEPEPDSAPEPEAEPEAEVD